MSRGHKALLNYRSVFGRKENTKEKRKVRSLKMTHVMWAIRYEILLKVEIQLKVVVRRAN